LVLGSFLQSGVLFGSRDFYIAKKKSSSITFQMEYATFRFIGTFQTPNFKSSSNSSRTLPFSPLVFSDENIMMIA
jgi:hypothetical protein